LAIFQTCFVWSQTLAQLPNELLSKVTLIKGNTTEVINQLHQSGFSNIYIDGGKTIQSLLSENLIDEMTITTIPVLLGDGIPLFGKQQEMRKFKCVATKQYPNGLVQNTYVIAAD